MVVGFSRETDAATETFLSHFYGVHQRLCLRGPLLYQTQRDALVRYGEHGVRGERGEGVEKSERS